MDLYAFLQKALFVVGAETLFGTGGWDAAAQADFEAFDARFPLLVAGVPAGLLGVSGARKHLAKRLEPGRPDRSAMCQHRAEALGAEVGPAEQGRVDLSVLWAALGNTIPAAFWTLAHLAAHPDALAAVTAEVRARPACDGAGLPLLQSAVSEALRLTTASITLRRALRPTVLELSGGHTFRIRQGDLVCLFPWLMHHDPEVFDDPDQFRVDRFLPTADGPPIFTKAGLRLRIPLMPYGGGVSTCPGRHLANAEIKQLVAALLSRFDLIAVDKSPPPPDKSRAGLGVLPPSGEFAVCLLPVSKQAHPATHRPKADQPPPSRSERERSEQSDESAPPSFQSSPGPSVWSTRQPA